MADAQESSELSGGIIEIIKPIIDPNDKIDDDLFVKIIRKTAHMTEFAALGTEVYLIFTTFVFYYNQKTLYTVVPIGLSFLCAVTDELIQLTSPGRSCEIKDMLIDLFGIIIGITITKIIVRLIAKSKNKTG